MTREAQTPTYLYIVPSMCLGVNSVKAQKKEIKK